LHIESGDKENAHRRGACGKTPRRLDSKGLPCCMQKNILFAAKMFALQWIPGIAALYLPYKEP
jgi:hypothetical protein